MGAPDSQPVSSTGASLHWAWTGVEGARGTEPFACGMGFSLQVDGVNTQGNTGPPSWCPRFGPRKPFQCVCEAEGSCTPSAPRNPGPRVSKELPWKAAHHRCRHSSEIRDLSM